MADLKIMQSSLKMAKSQKVFDFLPFSKEISEKLLFSFHMFYEGGKLLKKRSEIKKETLGNT